MILYFVEIFGMCILNINMIEVMDLNWEFNSFVNY